MTWDNGATLPVSNLPRIAPCLVFAASLLVSAVSLPRSRGRWERLATPEEIDQLRKTDLRRAA